jgi:tRNA G18 (ribose-2'-O)-methylase SpoU
MSEAIDAIHQLGYALVAAEQTDRSVPLHLWEEPASPGLALVMGNEVTGVEQDTLEACEHVVEIPQLGMKHSLNIATAAGVVLWEIVRKKITGKG